MRTPPIKPLSASEIARETIKQLAIRRVEPTPSHYAQIYAEISGVNVDDATTHALRKLLKQLPNDSLHQQNWINRWDKKILDHGQAALLDLFSECLQKNETQASVWPHAIRTLLQGWNAHCTGLTMQDKQAMLDRLCIHAAQDPQLPEKIIAMANTWLNYTGNAKPLTDDANGHPDSHHVQPSPNHLQTSDLAMLPANNIASTPPVSELETVHQAVQQANQVLQTVLIQTLDLGLIPRLHGYPKLQQDAMALLGMAQQCKQLKAWQALAKDLKALLLKVEVIGAQEDAVRADVIDLLQLVISNIGELVAEDAWLMGQVYVVQTMLSGPLDREKLKNAEKSIKEVIYKQSLLKHSLNEAKYAFKQMVGNFIDKLKVMGEASDHYGQKIEHYAQQLTGTEDINKINQLVEQLMQDTHAMQADVVRTRDSLMQAQQQALTAQQQVQSLQAELSELSVLVKVDQCTGVLNRRGMEEALTIEIARSQRQQQPLSVAMLDIDHFKQLTDQLGEEVGDQALQHLTAVVRRTLRVTDIIARTRGEEFVILLPNTSLIAAEALLTRLQRSLTKAYFLSPQDKRLITFSAGVTMLQAEDDMHRTLQRAERAMLHAKQLGKNRVVIDPPDHLPACP